VSVSSTWLITTRELPPPARYRSVGGSGVDGHYKSYMHHSMLIYDGAWNLLGLFDINMPLLYGEGAKAFHCLQEEIIKRGTDLAILAWQPTDSMSGLCPLLATSPKDFQHCHDIRPFSLSSADFSMSSKGLKIVRQLAIVSRIDNSGQPVVLAFGLVLGYIPNNPTIIIGIPLRKIGYSLFA
jgi:hypothetical protein